MSQCLLSTSVFLALILLQIGSESAAAQSLFERRSMNQIDQYRAYAARHRGDLLTILINENTDVENRDERSLDKSSSAAANSSLNYGIGGGFGNSIGSLSYGQQSSSERDFSGDTEFRSERQFTDRFTVVVEDVLPNGNLLISGTRLIAVQGDLRELRLTGIVRQYDILPSNSIPSSLVGNLRIELEAQGDEQAFSRQGWFSQKMNRLWPF